MNRHLLACILLCAPAAAAAQGGLSLDLRTGAFVPVLDLVEFGDPQKPNIELKPGQAVGAELLLGSARRSLGFYAAFNYAFSQLEHTSMLETEAAAQPSSDVDLFMVTAGVSLTLPLWEHLRPRLIAGAGIKRYDFDLVETDGLGWLTLEYGLGVTAAPTGSWDEAGVLITAEFRQYISTFDPATLPIGLQSVTNRRQVDNLFLFGLQFRLGQRGASASRD